MHTKSSLTLIELRLLPLLAAEAFVRRWCLLSPNNEAFVLGLFMLCVLGYFTNVEAFVHLALLYVYLLYS